MPDKCRFLYARRADTYCFKLTGHITYAESPAFSMFVDNLLESGVCNEIIIELSECVYLDSTNLGILA